MAYPPPYPQHLPPPTPPQTPVPARIAQVILWIQGVGGALSSLLVLAGSLSNLQSLDLPDQETGYVIGAVGASIFLIVGSLVVTGLVVLCASRLQPGRPGAHRGALVIEGVGTALGVLALIGVMAAAVFAEESSIFFAAIPVLIATAIPATALGCLLSPAARAYFHGLPPGHGH